MWWRRRCGPGGGDRCAALVALPAVCGGFQGNRMFSCNFDAWVLQASAAELCAALGALTGLGGETMPCSQFAALFQ